MKKILIVEDDQVVASAYKQRFAKAGFIVEVAEDGLDGLQLATTAKPDVVLLDLLMPRLDGLELLKYIRTHPDLASLPVVVFSNSYMTNLVENAWRAGANQCLMKASTTPAEVIDAVNKVLFHSTPQGLAAAPRAKLAPTSSPLANRPGAAAPRILHNQMTPGASHPASGSLRPGVMPKAEADPEFQAQIRQLFLKSSEARLASLHKSALVCAAASGNSEQSALMDDLFRQVHALVGNAAVAGCMHVAQVAGAYEAFIQALQQQPRFLNRSTLRTLTFSTESLQHLVGLTREADVILDRLPLALVLDSGPGAAQAAAALERGGFKINVAADPVQALSLLASMPCDLVVMAAELPGMNASKFLKDMRTQAGHALTSVIFSTSLTGFDAYAASELLGDNDVIARPFLLMEMTLKGTIAWHRRNLSTS